MRYVWYDEVATADLLRVQNKWASLSPLVVMRCVVILNHLLYLFKFVYVISYWHLLFAIHAAVQVGGRS